MSKLKALMEKRAALQEQMERIVEVADAENRAMSEEEMGNFDAAEKEIKAIDETLEREERARNLERKDPISGGRDEDQAEERAFADYVMGKVTELRAGEQNITMGNNGAIIPTTIANRIIKEVKDRCPIFEKSTIYNVKGNLKVPVWGKANTTHDIAVGYQTEFTEITADAGKFTSVDLGGYLAGALTLIGRSVENNGSFSVVDFIVKQIAEEIARAEAEAKATRERAARAERNRLAREKATASGKKVPDTAPEAEPVREERVADTKGGYAMTKAEKRLSDDFASNKGRLPYPVSGRHTIVATFGEQQHQELKYVRTNNSGIDIQTSPGADARAVFNGEVTRVFVVPGYNNSVIVRHGNYLTVYSNLSQVYVKAGDKVSTRQAIGKIFTDTEDGNATILHFQLWKEKTKLNPAPWLD